MKSAGSTPEHALWSSPSESGEYTSRALEIIERANEAAEEAFPWNYSNALRSRMIEKELMEPAGIRSWEEFTQELLTLEYRWREGRGKLASLLPSVDKVKVKRMAVCPLPAAADSPRRALAGDGVDQLFRNLEWVRELCPPPELEHEIPLSFGFLACWHPDVFLDARGQILRATVVGWLADADTVAWRTRFNLLMAEVANTYPRHKAQIIEAWRQIDPVNQDPVWRLMHQPLPSETLAAEACNLIRQICPLTSAQKWNHTQTNLLKLLKGRYATNPMLQSEAHLSKRGIDDALKPLRKAGLVKNIRGKGYYRVDEPPGKISPAGQGKQPGANE